MEIATKQLNKNGTAFEEQFSTEEIEVEGEGMGSRKRREPVIGM